MARGEEAVDGAKNCGAECGGGGVWRWLGWLGVAPLWRWLSVAVAVAVWRRLRPCNRLRLLRGQVGLRVLNTASIRPTKLPLWPSCLAASLHRRGL